MLKNKKLLLKEACILLLAVIIIISSGTLLANINNNKLSINKLEKNSESPIFQLYDVGEDDLQNTPSGINIEDEVIKIPNFSNSIKSISDLRFGRKRRLDYDDVYK